MIKLIIIIIMAGYWLLSTRWAMKQKKQNKMCVPGFFLFWLFTSHNYMPTRFVNYFLIFLAFQSCDVNVCLFLSFESKKKKVKKYLHISIQFSLSYEPRNKSSVIILIWLPRLLLARVWLYLIKKKKLCCRDWENKIRD